MSTTQEQQAVIDHAKYLHASQTHGIILVNAVAGSGKTHLLTQLTLQVPHDKGIYLSYNKSIATEASRKFPKSIACLTANALAYRNVVKALGLRVGTFSYRDIKESFQYDLKLYYIELIKQFCLSAYVDFDTFAAAEQLNDTQKAICTKYLEKMGSGEIECSHDFYMKVFHMLLASGDLDFPEQDFLLLDEAGDLNEVTLEIFKLLPAKIKVAVGDNNQNIYAFNHTINAFALLKDEGKHFKLTQSFRVSDRIASRIETFCKNYIDDEIDFKGIPVTSVDVKTRAFISRTNAGMINSMIELDRQGVNYTLVRSPDEIFKLPKILCYLKYEGTIADPMYRHLQEDVNDWYESPDLQFEHKSPLNYLQSVYHFDKNIQAAIRLILNKGSRLILDTYERAKNNKKANPNLTICTAHSVKGLEYDEVVIGEDLNTVVGEILCNIPDIDNVELTEEELQEMNLYYVACSRAKKSLVNAIHL